MFFQIAWSASSTVCWSKRTKPPNYLPLRCTSCQFTVLYLFAEKFLHPQKLIAYIKISTSIQSICFDIAQIEIEKHEATQQSYIQTCKQAAAHFVINDWSIVSNRRQIEDGLNRLFFIYLMIVKCYAIFDGQSQVISQYASFSQKNFLNFELSNVSKKCKKSFKIETEQTSNGYWYFRSSQGSKNTHFTLLQTSSMSTASSLIAKGIEFEGSKMSQEKIRMKIAQQIKIINANSKVEALSSNVMELQNIMKGNVHKIINNMSDLQTAERKSQRLSTLSLQLQNDSRNLQLKMKKKACMRKLIIAGIAGALVVFLVYYFFL